MAYNNIQGHTETYLAGADLTAEQFTFVVSDGDEVTQINAGEAATGVLFNDPASGRAATVVTGGQPNVYAGAAIAVGAEIASDDEGRAVTAVSTDIVLGKARHAAGGAGELVMIDFYGQGQYTKA